jgi:hypothetical protein
VSHKLKCRGCGAKMEDMEHLYRKGWCSDCRCANCGGTGFVFKNRHNIPNGLSLDRWINFDFTTEVCNICQGSGCGNTLRLGNESWKSRMYPLFENGGGI